MHPDRLMKTNTIENTHIEHELLNKLPDWCKGDLSSDMYYLVCTDDMDSLFTCERLHTVLGLEIGGFYDFKSGLWLNEKKTGYGWKTPIYVDLSIANNQYCYDNHRTFISNRNAVNPNVITRKYYEKYNFGTIALVAALYGGVDKMNEELRTILLAVDGGYRGYYNQNGKYAHINLYWLEKLGLTEYLVPILEKHDMKYFQDFSVENGLYDKITITPDGYLETPTYRVPECQFELVQPIKKEYASKYEVMQRINRNEKIIVSAETFKDNYILNIAV